MRIFSGKKAIFGPGGGVGGPRRPISLLLGIVFIALGVIPLLNQFGVIGFSIPLSPVGVVLWILALVGGVVLLWDAISENMAIMGLQQQLRMASLIIGLLFLVVGLVPILHSFGIVGFTIPEFAEVIKNVFFTIVGLLLLYGGTQGF